MNPSSRRIRASSSFSFDDGISTVLCFTKFALRSLVSMSAIGSVIPILESPFQQLTQSIASPTLFHNTRDFSPKRQESEADSAHLETAQVAPRAATKSASSIVTHLELLFALPLGNPRLLRHRLSP